MCLSVNGRKPRPIFELPPPFGDLQAAVIPFLNFFVVSEEFPILVSELEQPYLISEWFLE